MNKKKIAIISLCTLLLCGCGKQIPTLADGEQAIATFSDENLNISINDLYDNMKEQYALNSLIELMDKNILEKELPDDIENEMENAKATVKSMEDTYGKDQITSYFGSIDSYTNYLYINNLQQKAILNYAKGKVSDKEVNAYYEKNIYGDVTVDHILVKTNVTDETSSEDEEKLETEAKNKINEIIEKLNNADDKLETFKQLAKEYSDDEATKENGGSLGAINTDTLSSSYDELLEAARKLEDGKYSTELITTELGYHVIFKESTAEKPSLDSVKDSILETLGQEKIDDDDTLRISAMDELRKKYGMEIIDSDLKEYYSNYIANSIAQAKQSEQTK